MKTYEEIVALSGAIGVGKTTVAGIFSRIGAHVVNADALAKRAVLKDSPGYAQVVEEFGHEILNPDKDIDRRRLGDIVFSSPKARKRLEDIVHPLVRALADAEFQRASRLRYPVIIYECPLLFESGLYKEKFAAIVIVTASKETCLSRIEKRNGLTHIEAAKRFHSQLPIRDKVEKADFVIDNSGSLEELEARVIYVYEELAQRLTT